jgi:RNA-directed DNA polymerase
VATRVPFAERFGHAAVTQNPSQLDFGFAAQAQNQLYAALFSESALNDVFWSRFATTTGKGTDRLNGFQFSKRVSDELSVASAKCLTGTYRFAPYLEKLKTKGHKALPRVIGIPTVRDRIILRQLNTFIANVYPDRVPKNIANGYVRQIVADLQGAPDSIFVCCTDIKKFYDSVKRERLLKILERGILCKPALRLIARAITAPIVPKNTHRSRHKEFQNEGVGVPQGLAISNILASIYMKEVDEPMLQLGIKYWRYVDDVLIYGKETDVVSAYKSLKSRLRIRGLTLHSLHSGKTHLEPLHVPFGYLGYRFHWPRITVRDSTIENFLQSVAETFSDYIHNSQRRLDNFKYLTHERLRDIFVAELNERITGAISEKRRYGWISEISDQALLHRLDRTISAMFKRIPDFNRKAPTSLKRLARAYFEIKFNPLGGYIRNYDKIQTTVEKLNFLIERGRMAPGETFVSDKEINDKYARYLFQSLTSMLPDEGVAYG